uniref:Nucleoside phosphorylase domain-containing protein n=1 Tax=Castor canadensis TaxID=51338 RepID=A0A8C0WIM3_CASCN
MALSTTGMAVTIGIIGGTGLDDPETLEGRTEKYVDIPLGKPSDALILGKIKNAACVLLARHGRQHTIMPSKVNHQEDIWALKEEGCTHVIVTTACGSLREEIQPGDVITIDQFIDRTSIRPQTFYDGKAEHSCVCLSSSYGGKHKIGGPWSRTLKGGREGERARERERERESKSIVLVPLLHFAYQFTEVQRERP